MKVKGEKASDTGMPRPTDAPELRSRLSAVVRRHPGKLARRPQARPERLRPRGEAAAGAWGVAAPRELRGCAGCESGARATDVAWVGAARALAKRGAHFGALPWRLPEVPFATPPLGRGASSADSGQAGALKSQTREQHFGPGAGSRKRESRETRSPKRGIGKRSKLGGRRGKEQTNGRRRGKKEGMSGERERRTGRRTSWKAGGKWVRRNDGTRECGRNEEEGLGHGFLRPGGPGEVWESNPFPGRGGAGCRAPRAGGGEGPARARAPLCVRIGAGRASGTPRR